ncbi:hypothetical protein C7S16_3536 [Burkholderia thailandensis]|uniref:Uncharacterized protein n=1 Tax=Burkholderia thailandensis TaxID=57975 RepID=A0AAW9D2Q6_BURTH|nr:hypothetical protein [Burkholderia thailandensis]
MDAIASELCALSHIRVRAARDAGVRGHRAKGAHACGGAVRAGSAAWDGWAGWAE